MKQDHKTGIGKLALGLAERINRTLRGIGHVLAWSNVAVIAVIFGQVTLRYGFHHGMVTLEELMWHLYALAAMAGLSFALVIDSHIRIDVLRRRCTRRAQAALEIGGILLLLLPFLAVIFLHSLEWVAESYRLGETSPNPTGLPYRWLIKAVIPASFLLLFMATLARLIGEIAVLGGAQSGASATPGG